MGGGTNTGGGTINTGTFYDETNPEVSRLRAEAKYREAQAAYFLSQRDGQDIDNRTAEALAQSAELALKRERLKETWDGASNARHRTLDFTSDIDANSVDAAIDVLQRWHRIDVDRPNQSYRFVICSNGGNVIHGMKLYSTLRMIATKRKVITVATGICASMGAVVHQAGTLRVIEPGCSYMIHDVSGGAGGSLGSMEDTMAYYAKINRQMHVLLAEKSHLTVDQMAELGKRKDSWFLGQEVVDQGLADEVGYAADYV